jgi:hypothetical protein
MFCFLRRYNFNKSILFPTFALSRLANTLPPVLILVAFDVFSVILLSVLAVTSPISVYVS